MNRIQRICLLSGLGLLLPIGMYACEVCKKQQPKFLRGITHGTGPQSNWDYVIVGITAAIVIACLWFSIRALVRPGEKEPEHIKNSIFKHHE